MDTWAILKSEIRAGHARFDAQVRTWIAGHEAGGGRVHCRRGCRNCCALAVNATFIEALCLAEALTDGQRGALALHVEKTLAIGRSAADLKGWLRGYRDHAGSCPFLDDDGACGVYEQRPYSCRALLSTRPADWCGVDLSSLHPLEKQAFLGSLDPEVVAWPTHYAGEPQEIGHAAESEATWRMIETFGFAVAGNLPILVWLEEEYRLSDLVPQGKEAVRRLLVEKEVDIPFLVGVTNEQS